MLYKSLVRSHLEYWYANSVWNPHRLGLIKQACQFIADIFSKLCGPVKLEICAKNMLNMLRSHVRYKLACLKCGLPTIN